MILNIFIPTPLPTRNPTFLALLSPGMQNCITLYFFPSPQKKRRNFCFELTSSIVVLNRLFKDCISPLAGSMSLFCFCMWYDTSVQSKPEVLYPAIIFNYFFWLLLTTLSLCPVLVFLSQETLSTYIFLLLSTIKLLAVF